MKKKNTNQIAFLMKILLIFILFIWSNVDVCSAFKEECRAQVRIAVEGMPGAGKTSSLLNLIVALPKNFVLLSETNPPPLQKEWMSLSPKQQTRFFHKLWVDRLRHIESLTGSTGYSFLLDRSFFSNLAYKYAYDRYHGTSDYNEYLKLFQRDLQKFHFTKVVVLDCDPLVGLQRRKEIDKTTPSPWGERVFLEALREFYLQELPMLTSDEIVVINTDDLSVTDVTGELNRIIGPSCIGLTSMTDRKLNLPKIEDQIMRLSKSLELDFPHSPLITVFGYPTIYFQRHSLQFDGNEVVLLDNQRLEEISKRGTISE